MEDIVEEYMNNVKKGLYNLVSSEEYLNDLQQNLEEYVQQFSNCTYQQLVEQFGEPEEVAAEYIGAKKPNGPREMAKSRKKVIILVAIIIALVLVLVVFVYTTSRDRQAFFTDTVTEEEIE